jgi:hypothetical protein
MATKSPGRIRTFLAFRMRCSGLRIPPDVGNADPERQFLARYNSLSFYAQTMARRLEFIKSFTHYGFSSVGYFILPSFKIQ